MWIIHVLLRIEDVILPELPKNVRPSPWVKWVQVTVSATKNGQIQRI